MPENFYTSQKDTSPEEETASSIRKQIQEANGGGNTIADRITEVGDLRNINKKDKKIRKKLEVNGNTKSSNKIPRPPTSMQSSENSEPRRKNNDKEDESNKLQKRPQPRKNIDKKTRPSNPSYKEKKSKLSEKEKINKREAMLSKIIAPNDPVFYGGTVENLGKDGEGAWFYTGESEIVMDKSGKGVDQKSKVKIEYKDPSGNVIEQKEVTWSEITPSFNKDKEYTNALRKIRKVYEQVKKTGDNEAYEKHLANLGSQLMYFSIELDKRQKEKIAKLKVNRERGESEG